MPAVLNLLGTQVAVYGNHDFDQGLENTLVCKEACQ
jgi:2',3'-cyclic-nucleotide 2'-phosphodiesterase (5'-nucleotidase family)